jgi:GWxTD domain-containing protein
MLLSDVKVGAGKEKEITPLVNNNVGSLKEFYFFFEVISKYDTAVNRAYYYKITDDKSKTLYQDTLMCEFLPGVNQIFQKIPTDNLYIGNFKLEVYDSRALHTGKYFTYKWGNIPVNMNDIDLAINQLVYIASEDELDKIKEGKTKEERQRRFVKFWRDKDPSPKTPKNELMMEYYNRIKIANERYSHYVEGWKTDMGMVFIIFGNPGNIERHPFDGNSKPYEIWDYYNVNRQFIFIDDSGYGDYRLLTPIWDERTKIRY